MKHELPRKIICAVSSNGVDVKDIMIKAEFRVSFKNSYFLTIGPTDKEGNAKISSQEILEQAKQQQDFAIMDYMPIEDVFAGSVAIKIMDEKELEKAVNSFELFKDYYSFKSNYKENFDQAIIRLSEIDKNTLKLNASIEPSKIELITGQ